MKALKKVFLFSRTSFRLILVLCVTSRSVTNWTTAQAQTNNETRTIASPALHNSFDVQIDGGGKPKRESYAETPESAGQDASGESIGEQLQPARDGIYNKITALEREILPYAPLREADVFWQKRIWRVIDLGQKMNQTFRYNSDPFLNILLDVAQKPNVRLYLDDGFKQPVTYADVEKATGRIDTITVVDPVTYEESKKIVKNDFNWESVTKFRLKEDWIFDKQSSKMIVRIIGIAPIQEVYDENDNYRGDRALFWAYYPDLRSYLVKHEAFNPFNDSNRLSWDDIFEMRYFSSFIMKESNVLDRRISDYATDRDALLESEDIKNKILEYEENLWQY